MWNQTTSPSLTNPNSYVLLTDYISKSVVVQVMVKRKYDQISVYGGLFVELGGELMRKVQSEF
jgi:hypothetical protein